MGEPPNLNREVSHILPSSKKSWQHVLLLLIDIHALNVHIRNVSQLLGERRSPALPGFSPGAGVLDMGPNRFAAPAPIFWFSEARELEGCGGIVQCSPRWFKR